MPTANAPPPPPPPRWVLDLNFIAPSKPKATGIPDPPGYAVLSGGSKRRDASAKQVQATARKPPTADEMDTLKLKKAWELAIAPAKQLPMNAFGMWMSGNSLQIFSVMMVFMLFKTPFQALLSINSTFARFESDGTKSQILGIKIVFVLTNMLAFGLGIWKINKMGLLPTTRSDWLAWETPRLAMDRVYPSFPI